MADAPQVAFNNHAAEKYPHYGITPVEPYFEQQPHYSYQSQNPNPSPGSGDTLGQNDQDVVGKANTPGRTVLGLSHCTFWILFILFELILVGVIIGGSVGGTLAVQKANKAATCTNSNTIPSGAALPTSTYSTPSAIQVSSPVPTPSLNHASVTMSMPAIASSTPSFAMYSALPFSDVHMINTTCPSSTLSFSGDVPDLGSQYQYNCQNNRNLRDPDLTSFTAYTLSQCVDACSQWNAAHQNRACKGIVVSYRLMYKRMMGNGANCWLKSGADGGESSVDGTVAILV